MKLRNFKNYIFYLLLRLKNRIVILYNLLFQKFNQLIISTYSQYGEDLVLDKLLGYRKSGFYVDVGTNDPIIFNNTYRFYKKGWKGINIEPNFSLFKKIKKNRKLDINLNVGIANKKDFLEFYLIDPHTLSTFDSDVAKQAEVDGYLVKKKIIIKVLPLKEIFNNYLENKIDFLSIDVEGFDLIVLKSNDWKKYRPKFIIVEINRDLSSIKNFLITKNYIQIFNNSTNAIFKDILDET